LLVRTWNLFHGNADPPERRGFLREAVALAATDEPDVLCLQELPTWSLARLGDWSGMTALGDVAARPMIGPLPSTPEIGRLLTDLNHGLLRSAFSGQGNGILLGSELRLLERDLLVLNPWGYRRREARCLALPLVPRLAWGKERRVCQVVRLGRDGGGTLVVANLHATSLPDKRLADAELLRAATFVDGYARPDEPVLLCGDFNLSLSNSRVLPELQSAEWRFSGAGRGIDHILVRGLEAAPLRRWPEARRRIDGRLVSDHPPAEREVA
jgi:endonuclease/exonuclease/phosphatase family metal-dependent hydrolase